MKNKLKIIVSFIGIVVAVIIALLSLHAEEDKKGHEYLNEPKEVSAEVNDEFVPIMSGWVNTNVTNVMKSPSESSEVVDTLFFNDRITYVDYDDNWVKMNIDGEDVYVSLKDIDNNETRSRYYEVPYNTGFKSFMDYSSITFTNSLQYELQSSYATTGNYGIRMIDNRYCIALGSYFSSNVGQYVDLILKNGTVIPCVLSEQKDDAHTDSSNIITVHNGCLSEFIVDVNYLNNDVLKYGDISYCCDEWNSPVVSIKVYDKNLFY